MLINAGQLDTRLTIQRRVETADEGGGQTIAWSDYLTVWAKVDTSGGREFVAAQERMPELTHLVTIRYRPGITAKHRLRCLSSYGDTVYAIQSVIDPGLRHEQLQLLCTEVAPTDADLIYPP